jgi:hypothetical protein
MSCLLKIVVFFGLFITVLLNSVQTRRFMTLVRIVRQSHGIKSFMDWIHMIRSLPYLSFTDHSHPGIHIPIEPHLILCTHTKSHLQFGCLFTLAGLVTAPANIVCFRDYTYKKPLIGGIMHTILQNEIRIDNQAEPAEKEFQMVRGIRHSLQAGRNVIIFIDHNQGASKNYFKSLNRKVLGYFPGVSKQLVHILEPTGVNELHFQTYPATLCLDEIVQRHQYIIT